MDWEWWRADRVVVVRKVRREIVKRIFEARRSFGEGEVEGGEGGEGGEGVLE